MSQRHRVVVIGAGFGGLAVVRGLRRAAVDVTVVDANNFHTFQPLLYQVATAGLDVDDICYAIRGIFRRQGNVTVRMARVTAVDVQQRVVHTSMGTPLPFDTLVVAAGAVSESYGVPGVDEHAFALKSVNDAVRLREHVLARFEAAAAYPSLSADGALNDGALNDGALNDAALNDGALNVVICGGGPTGVEMAGGLTELFQRVLAKDFRGLDVGNARVTLVEAADRLLGTFSTASSERARRTLARRGVDVIVGVGVASVDPHRVVLVDGRTLPAHTTVWAAGVRANPLAQTLAEAMGVTLGRGGRIVVGPDLAVPSHPQIFAVGDIAADAREPLPQVAQPAIQGGRHVARQIVRRLDGSATEPFEYTDKGSMATIGRHDAVAEFPSGRRLGGPLGWLAWLGLHIVYLMGFRNRANVLVNWAWNYLTYDRGARLLSERAAGAAEAVS